LLEVPDYINLLGEFAINNSKTVSPCSAMQHSPTTAYKQLVSPRASYQPVVAK